MYYFITILIIICSILLVIAILLQNSKGGGLVSGMGATTQMMGVRRAADFLEKATWYMAIALLVLSVVASMTIDRGVVDSNKSALEEQLNNTPDPTSSNTNFPTEVPKEGQE